MKARFSGDAAVAEWKVHKSALRWKPSETALLVCDMWRALVSRRHTTGPANGAPTPCCPRRLHHDHDHDHDHEDYDYHEDHAEEDHPGDL